MQYLCQVVFYLRVRELLVNISLSYPLAIWKIGIGAAPSNEVLRGFHYISLINLGSRANDPIDYMNDPLKARMIRVTRVG